MKPIYFTLVLIAIVGFSYANNIKLANISLSGQNTASQFSLINFDVSWENSWRTITNEANYDGAWIFVKFRKKSSNTWEHATLNSTGSTMPANSVLQPSTDGKGAWMYRSLPGADFVGDVNYTGAKLRWNYGADGVLNTDSVEIRVFALEMVYVPGGAYKLGSGGTETGHFFDGVTNNPFNVTSEGSITVSSSATPGTLSYASGGDQLGPIPAGVPKGFNAFWIMKYESSRQQYVDFLNNLDLAKTTNRNNGSFTGTHPNLVSAGPERAMGNLSINDQSAFADWSSLRPFTELEYEKTCRGANQQSVPNEYPWGNTTIAATTNTGVTNPLLENETATDGNANYFTGLSSTSVGRTLRTGIYATASSTRQSSGGSFYGVMEMAGNVEEVCISVGSGGATGGRAFTNKNGDGNLDINGDANVATWPTIAGGYALRGGYFYDYAPLLRTSDRDIGLNGIDISTRPFYPSLGIRLARTAE